MKPRQNAIADELEDLLDREHAILLAGRIQDLPQLAAYKTRLVDQLSGHSGVAGLTRVQRKAQRNARLLHSAGQGIRSVTDRIAALRAGPQPFSTYGANGAKKTVGTSKKTVERRA